MNKLDRLDMDALIEVVERELRATKGDSTPFSGSKRNRWQRILNWVRDMDNEGG